MSSRSKRTITRFACIGDYHGQAGRLASVIEALADQDFVAVLMTGDFRCGAWDDSTRIALEMVAKLGVPILFVPGNHDEPGIVHPGNVDGRGAEIGGMRIAGVGGAGPHRFGFPYEWSEDDIRARHLPDWDILIAHAPPFGTTLDRLRGCGEHAGSVAIRERAEAHGPGLLLCGHIHECVGVDLVGSCTCYNVGALGEPYGRAQFGLVEFASSPTPLITHVDLESGRTWQA